MTDSLRILFLIFDAAAEVCLEAVLGAIVFPGNKSKYKLRHEINNLQEK